MRSKEQLEIQIQAHLDGVAGVARVYTPKDYDLTAIMDQIVDLAAEGLKTAAE